ncbi:MAG TPA: YraN family protein [Acidobacteriota bacterium]|jgi:putative endonuclease|nr:YraN family protein [Acidobacteriota bacterium]
MEKSLIEPFNLSQFGEDQACLFLKKQKLKILDRNYCVRGGEIDIVAEDKKFIIFVEVKTRSDNKYAQPWENVAFKKRKNIKAAAREYIHHRKNDGKEIRFDVISIVLNDAMKPQIEWIQQAFD